MRKIIRLVTISLILALLSSIMYSCKKEPIPATADNPFALASTGIRPAGDKIADRNVNVEGTDAINLALELYQLACLNDKNTPYRAVFSNCPSSFIVSSLDNKVILNILELKNNNEYYRIDYRLRYSIPLFDGMPSTFVTKINNSIRLVSTERRYANTDMDYTRYQIIPNAQTNESGIPYTDWSVTSDIEESVDPAEEPSKKKIFSASQEGVYTKSGFVIDDETVTTAAVTYDAAAGVYSVSMELDCVIDENDYNKATEFTRPLIQKGSGADNAKYTRILIEFDMWDNGYFKEYNSTEDWTAAINFGITISFVSTFKYHDVYSYDAADCDISKYYAEGNFIDNYNDD